MHLTLSRPELRNALNPELIAELTQIFLQAAADRQLRVIVLRGQGSYFCAGADLNWMREMAQYSPEENLADALKLALLFEAIDQAPQAVISVVQGGAFGGGLGLMCCSDFVIASSDCQFAFSEVRLGISPATIGPYVAARIGQAAARDLLLSGRRFDSAHAWQIQLVNRIVEAAELESALDQCCSEYLQAAPLALAETKQILLDLQDDPLLGGTAGERAQLRQRTSQLIANLRGSKEGQAGLAAFLRRENAPWTED